MIAIPGKRFDVGAVNIVRGTAEGITTKRSQYFSPTAGHLPPRGAGARFGLALATGRFDRGPDADLIVGAPYANSVAYQDGAVHALFGSAQGVRLADSQYLSPADPAFASPQPGAVHFGIALGKGDFNGDGRLDLAIGQDEYREGIPCQACQGDRCTGGGVYIIYSAPSGLEGARSAYLTQDTPGMAGDGSQLCDSFGSAVVVESRTPNIKQIEVTPTSDQPSLGGYPGNRADFGSRGCQPRSVVEEACLKRVRGRRP